MNVFIYVFVLQNVLKIVSLDTAEDASSEIGLNPKELILKYGYTLEVHTIQTEDGYLLEVHRIPGGKNKKILKNALPVLLYPGLYVDSSSYACLGPNRSLAYILADRGYDVWLGNHRGSTFCKKHIKLDPYKDVKKFWDFSLQELATYDIPATIDYILNKTNKKNINYIGISQATTTVLALLSENPLYNEKIRLLTLLSPLTSLKNTRIPFIDVLKANLPYVWFFIEKYTFYELFPLTDFTKDLAKHYCYYKSNFQNACIDLVSSIFGCTFEKIDRMYLPVILSNIPAGGSVGQLIHYVQLRDGLFRKLDYGKEKNLIRYNSETPPMYNLSNVQVPTAIFYGKQDFIVVEEDFNSLVTELSKTIVYQKIIEVYNHADTLIANDSSELVNNDILALLKLYR